MVFEQVQIYYILLNILEVLLAFGLAVLCFRFLSIKGKNSRILFMLYIIYWIPCMVTREYTGLIQLHFELWDKGLLLWIPLMAYGVIGIFWRPLSDLFSYHLRSRKSVLYISLALQMVCMVPMFAYPCLATNIVQSIGAGIGASCIGLFNLMFNQQEAKRKVFSTVSILSIPPLLAQLASAGLMDLVTSFENPNHTAQQFVDVVKYLWLIAIIFIVIGFILTIFFKERRRTMWILGSVKQPVNSRKSHAAFGLVIAAVFLVALANWATVGPTCSVEVAYIGNKLGTDTRGYEGYTSTIFALGELTGIILCTVWLSQTKNKHYINSETGIVAVGFVITVLYLIISAYSKILNITTFIWFQTINGLGYGLISTVLLGVALKKFFPYSNKWSPMSIYNLVLALGTCGGAFVNSIFKGSIYDQMHGFSTFTWQDYIWANWNVHVVCLAAVTVAMALFIGYFVLEKKNPVKWMFIDGKKFKSHGEAPYKREPIFSNGEF